jgi:hypothetical protein
MGMKKAREIGADRIVGQLVGTGVALATASAAILVAAWQGVPLGTAALRLVSCGVIAWVIAGFATRLLVRSLLRAPRLPELGDVAEVEGA